jgi:DNA-binding transcriptional LysR family regulator
MERCVMDMLSAVKVFVRVVAAGSFSAVARESGVSHSAVTRQITQLEEHFGVRCCTVTHGGSA